MDMLKGPMVMLQAVGQRRITLSFTVTNVILVLVLAAMAKVIIVLHHSHGSYQLFDSQHHSKRGAAGFGAAANLLLRDCVCDELAGSLHGQAAGDTASNQLAAWHGWCTFWGEDNC
ncbi:hypothetical protein OEZ86_010288 [Tetradesmus obliquus]|nr:hypothetical protein OEZ86_010288 [Tetradesmus obliquus]